MPNHMCNYSGNLLKIGPVHSEIIAKLSTENISQKYLIKWP